MTQALYMEDWYLSEFDAKVMRAEGMRVVLDRTAFYPNSGGQLNDTGKMEIDGTEFEVVDVKKENGEIVHILDAAGLAEGDIITGKIDGNRRYRMMRMHTAAHLLSAVVAKQTGALVTGKQLGMDKSRIDFSLENFDKEMMKEFTREANKYIEAGARVKGYALSREKALKIPGIVRLAERMPPDIPELRIVEIEGIDIQACGGTHVREIKEIGKMSAIASENKGRTNRRVYFTLE
jgi:misacylated tRNA(Ala) deacylase